MTMEVIDRWESVMEKLKSLNLSQLTLMDVIYLAGVITLIVFAVKVVGKLLKVILIVLAIALFIFWMSQLGLFSV